MATSYPYAYNPSGIPYDGFTQVGTIMTGDWQQIDFTTNPGGYQWWAGPDEDLGYIIAKPVPNYNQPNPLGISAGVAFNRSPLRTEASFLSLVQVFTGQSFASGDAAKSYLNTNGYWTNWGTAPNTKGSAVGDSIANSWLTSTGSSDWAVGTSDFTIEWFQYQLNNGKDNYIFAINNTTFTVGFKGGGNVMYVYLNGTLLNGTPMPPGGGITVANNKLVWYHVAISRSSGTLNVYHNGIRIYTGADSSNITDSSSLLYLLTQSGSPLNSYGANWPGYMNNFRWVNGTGLYTGATLTIPTSPLTAISGTKLLLLFPDVNNITSDYSGTNKVVTNAGAVGWTSSAPF